MNIAEEQIEGYALLDPHKLREQALDYIEKKKGNSSTAVNQEKKKT